MTDKEIKRLSRSDLLELLIEQKRVNEELKAKISDSDNGSESRVAEVEATYEAKIADIEAAWEAKLAEAEANCEARIAATEADCDAKLAEMECKVEDNSIHIDNVGSIAEASLQLNGVFEAADAAATQFLDSVMKNNEEKAQLGDKMVKEAEEKSAELIAQAEQESQDIRNSADAYSQEVHEKADAYWAEISEKLEKFYDDHRGLRELMKLATED